MFVQIIKKIKKLHEKVKFLVDNYKQLKFDFFFFFEKFRTFDRKIATNWTIELSEIFSFGPLQL
jgi:hypothetical protein